jgi:hypothetical protein
VCDVVGESHSVLCLCLSLHLHVIAVKSALNNFALKIFRSGEQLLYLIHEFIIGRMKINFVFAFTMKLYTCRTVGNHHDHGQRDVLVLEASSCAGHTCMSSFRLVVQLHVMFAHFVWTGNLEPVPPGN